MTKHNKQPQMPEALVEDSPVGKMEAIRIAPSEGRVRGFAKRILARIDRQPDTSQESRGELVVPARKEVKQGPGTAWIDTVNRVGLHRPPERPSSFVDKIDRLYDSADDPQDILKQREKSQ